MFIPAHVRVFTTGWLRCLLVSWFGAAGLASGAVAQAVPPAPVQAPAAAATMAVDSPRAAFRDFRALTRVRRWNEAARFLSVDDHDRERAPELARRLNAVIDSLYLLDPETISAVSSGRLDDDLPPDDEEVAQVSIGDSVEPIRLVRAPRGHGIFWIFTPDTVARVDHWYATLRTRWIRDALIAAGLTALLHEGPFELYYWQWLAFPIIALIAWGMGYTLRLVAKPLIEGLAARTATPWDDQIAASIGPPVTLAFAMVIFVVGATLLQLTRTAFLMLGEVARAGLAFAFFWALWRSSSVLVTWAMSRTWVEHSASVRSLLAIASNLARAAIVAVGFLAMLTAFDYPIGTVLAGLGIGGIALAFGAQKTLENLFGSVSLAIDQPFRLGDFVKVEDFIGTVENIGLRSTRFRTLDRTLVTIPNGKLADERIESFEARDRMRLAMTISLTYDTTREQLQAVLQGLERTLATHPRIWPGAIVVTFKELGSSSLDIEVMAWFQVPTWGDFQACRQEVLLGFMDVVERAGTRFAFPTQTLHIAAANPKASEAHSQPQ